VFTDTVDVIEPEVFVDVRALTSLPLPTYISCSIIDLFVLESVATVKSKTIGICCCNSNHK
jgi:hypothetical protein